MGFVGSDEHHLEVEGHGLGLDGAGAHVLAALGRVLHAAEARAQGAQEPLPGSDVGRDVVHADDEEAAVGAVQGAGLDQREIGVERAHLGFALDAAHEVEIGGVVLDDHGRARERAVVHE
ncbi:hypothetical protein DSECCO2_630090 [anaerobic digester metagenome]